MYLIRVYIFKQKNSVKLDSTEEIEGLLAVLNEQPLVLTPVHGFQVNANFPLMVSGKPEMYWHRSFRGR